jgi:hypothetical protein
MQTRKLCTAAIAGIPTILTRPCNSERAQAHVGGMGSACAFSPGRPHLLAALSKGAELAVIDVGNPSRADAAGTAAPSGPRVVARQQLAGPVFSCAWLAAGTFGCEEEQLAVVGADGALRLYDMGQAGALGLWASAARGRECSCTKAPSDRWCRRRGVTCN